MDVDEPSRVPDPSVDRPLGPEAKSIFHRAVGVGSKRLVRHPLALAINGLLGGIYICFSGLAAMSLYAIVKPGVGEEAAWAIGSLLFPIGFLFVVVAKAELFTENFLAPVFAAAKARKWDLLARFWGVTLALNLVGILAMALAWSAAPAELLPGSVRSEFATHAERQLALPPLAMFLKAVFGGVLVTLMVWLALAGESHIAKALLIAIPAFLIMLLRLSHSMTQSFEILVGSFVRGSGFDTFALVWLPLVLLGNVLGGTLIVTLLHYGQRAADHPAKERERARALRSRM